MTLPATPDSALYVRIKAAFNNASDAEIGRQVKLTKQSVGRWKDGGRPRDAVLDKISKITNVPIEWLLTGNESFLDKRTLERLKLEVHSESTDMTLNKFLAELQSLGVEDFNPAKGLSHLTQADMDEILAITRSTVKTMIEQRIKMRQKE